MNSIIYHITSQAAWETAQKQGFYTAESLITEGFIHCSTKSQLVKTANRFFCNQTDLIVLSIQVEKVNSPVKYESADNDLFPHIYGKLNLEAVTKVVNLPVNQQGLFEFPMDI